MSQTFSQHEHTHHAPGVASSQNMQSWPNIIMVGIWTLTHAIKHTCSKLDGSEKQLSTKLICNCHMCTTHVGYTSQSHIETHDKLHRTHTRTHKHRPARGCLEEDRGSSEGGTTRRRLHFLIASCDQESLWHVVSTLANAYHHTTIDFDRRLGPRST